VNDRTTAEIVADLRETRVTLPVSTGTRSGMTSNHTTTYTKASALAREAADRLAELEDEQNVLLNQWRDKWQKELDALRPPCPTCGGIGVLVESLPGGNYPRGRCPDCVDGKVSIEQLVATYNAVWDEWNWNEETRRLYMTDASFHAAIHILRGVKP
jgi:hypothetical protein